MPDVRKYMRDKKAIEERKKATEERSYEDKLRTHHKVVWIRGVIAFAIIIVAFFVISFAYQNLKYNEIIVQSSTEREESMMSEYVSLGGEDYILRCSRDGAACVDNRGKTVWDLTFEMQHPLVDVCEQYAAIAEASGNKVYIVNTEGKKGEMETLLPIRQVRVGSQGIVAVVLDDGSKNWINFYSKEGELLAENKAPLESKGYPLSIDVSNDGKKLIISYMQVQGASLDSVIAFYNFDSVGYNVTDHLMSSTLYEDTLFPSVAFLTNNLAVAFGDKMCIGYEGTQNPEEIFKLNFNEEIESVFYDEDHIGFVFRTESSQSTYRMEVYTKKGRKVFEREFEQEYEKIKFIGEEILLFNERELSIYNIRGKEKFRGTFENAVSDIMGTGRAYQYMVLYKNQWQKVKLK